MNTRTAFWYDLMKGIYELRCLELYKAYVDHVNRLINWIVGIVSCASVLAWLKDMLPPYICSTVICLAQVLGVITPSLKLEKIHSALNYMIPDEQDVLASMEEYWWTINACEPKESSVIKKRSEFNSRLRGLENKYLSDLTLHFPKSIRNKATDYRDQYVNDYFYSKKESEELV